jgi:spermidine/putrescine transport system substrate-binding protein
MGAIVFGNSLLANVEKESLPVLNFYNWTAYVDEDVVDEFEENFNCRVNQIYYQSMDDRDQKVMRNQGKGLDVIMLGGSDVAEYAAKGWILPLGEDNIPNYKYLNPRWVKAWPKTDSYAIPYLWGTSGLIYRSDRVKEAITSWKQLYQPAEYLKGHIMLSSTHRISIGYGLRALGYSYNSEDKMELGKLEKLLLEQKPYVQTYGYLKTDASSGIVSGETWIGQTWNGDALLLQRRNPAIRYVIPEEGSEIWVDYFTVSAKSDHPQLAKDFINFMQDPKNNARCAQALQFASPNLKARQFLPEAFLENEIIYPSEETLESCFFQRSVSPHTQRLMVTIWSKVVN